MAEIEEYKQQRTNSIHRMCWLITLLSNTHTKRKALFVQRELFDTLTTMRNVINFYSKLFRVILYCVCVVTVGSYHFCSFFVIFFRRAKIEMWSKEKSITKLVWLSLNGIADIGRKGDLHKILHQFDIMGKSMEKQHK